MQVLLETLLIQILGMLYLIWRGGQALPQGWWRKSLRAVLLADLLFVFIVVLLRHQLSSALLAFSIVFVCSWAFVLIYIVPFVLLINGGRKLYKHITGRSLREVMGQRRYQQAKWGLFLVSIALSALILTYGYKQAATPHIVEHEIALSKPLGGDREHLRVLFVADMHFGEAIRRPFAERLLAIYQQTKPDLMLVGGDMFDYSADLAYLDSIPEIMQQITPPLGSYYVLGNHEYRSDMAKKKAWVALVGGILLVDSIATPGGIITIIGRDDYTQEETRAPLSTLIEQIPEASRHLPRILLEHQPRQLDRLEGQGLDLALYGHTHDGQIFPFSLMVRAYYPIAHGLTEEYGPSVYVSSGYGAAGPAMRLFTDSEVVVFDLYNASREAITEP